MIYVQGEGTNVSVALTSASVTLNNLTVSVDSNGVCEIETKGPWSGKITDLIGLVEEATGLSLGIEVDEKNQ